jgi:hypothetical protein
MGGAMEKLPTKVKNFGWKFLHGILPCMGVLTNIHIKVNISCPLCYKSCEDIRHTLFLCVGAKFGRKWAYGI